MFSKYFIFNGFISLFMLFVSFVWGAKNMVDFPPPLLEKIRSYGFRNSFFHCFCLSYF